jgi:hypothetical protein
MISFSAGNDRNLSENRPPNANPPLDKSSNVLYMFQKIYGVSVSNRPLRPPNLAVACSFIKTAISCELCELRRDGRGSLYAADPALNGVYGFTDAPQKHGGACKTDQHRQPIPAHPARHQTQVTTPSNMC